MSFPKSVDLINIISVLRHEYESCSKEDFLKIILSLKLDNKVWEHVVKTVMPQLNDKRAIKSNKIKLNKRLRKAENLKAINSSINLVFSEKRKRWKNL